MWKPSQNAVLLLMLNLYIERSEKCVPGNYRVLSCYWEHFFSLFNVMYRTEAVPLNSINILAQEQFGSGGQAEV